MSILNPPSKNVTCPVCNGTGVLEKPAKRRYFKVSLEKAAMAQELRAQGFSYRRIAKLLGFTNPGSVEYLIKRGQNLND